VVAHYDTCFKLSLSDQEKKDLIEYLKGLQGARPSAGASGGRPL